MSEMWDMNIIMKLDTMVPFEYKILILSVMSLLQELFCVCAQAMKDNVKM